MLLDDRNAMNEDVQRLVLELEKMQLMHNKMAAMKDELQNNHDVCIFAIHICMFFLI